MKTLLVFVLPSVAAFAALLSTSAPATSAFAPVMSNSAVASTTYCTAGTSIIGCVASISSTGVPSIGANSGFVVRADFVPGKKNGRFRYSISGPIAVPWCSGGTSFLCVKSPAQNVNPVTNSDGNAGACDGALTWDFFPWMTSGKLGFPLFAGETFYVQAVYADFPACKGTTWSNALEFTLLP